MLEHTSTKIARSLTWYGVGAGAIIAIGTAYLGAGIGVIASVRSILPTLTKDNIAMNIQILNSLNAFMVQNFLDGGAMIGLGVLVGLIAIFRSKTIRKEEQKEIIYSQIEKLQRQLFDLKLSLITNKRQIETDITIKNRYESIIAEMKVTVQEIDEDFEKTMKRQRHWW